MVVEFFKDKILGGDKMDKISKNIQNKGDSPYDFMHTDHHMLQGSGQKFNMDMFKSSNIGFNQKKLFGNSSFKKPGHMEVFGIYEEFNPKAQKGMDFGQKLDLFNIQPVSRKALKGNKPLNINDKMVSFGISKSGKQLNTKNHILSIAGMNDSIELDRFSKNYLQTYGDQQQNPETEGQKFWRMLGAGGREVGMNIGQGFQRAVQPLGQEFNQRGPGVELFNPIRKTGSNIGKFIGGVGSVAYEAPRAAGLVSGVQYNDRGQTIVQSDLQRLGRGLSNVGSNIKQAWQNRSREATPISEPQTESDKTIAQSIGDYLNLGRKFRNFKKNVKGGSLQNVVSGVAQGAVEPFVEGTYKPMEEQHKLKFTDRIMTEDDPYSYSGSGESIVDNNMNIDFASKSAQLLRTETPGFGGIARALLPKNVRDEVDKYQLEREAKKEARKEQLFKIPGEDGTLPKQAYKIDKDYLGYLIYQAALAKSRKDKTNPMIALARGASPFNISGTQGSLLGGNMRTKTEQFDRLGGVTTGYGMERATQGVATQSLGTINQLYGANVNPMAAFGGGSSLNKDDEVLSTLKQSEPQFDTQAYSPPQQFTTATPRAQQPYAYSDVTVRGTAPRSTPQGTVYSPFSKRVVTYTRGPYRKHAVQYSGPQQY